ncbi:MAG: hypothetical protein WC599_11680 [Bacteroidales bacterium]
MFTKKENLCWALALNYWVITILGVLLYPLIEKILINLFGYHTDFESIEISIGLLSATISLIFYGLLVLNESTNIQIKPLMDKWWHITWKWDLMLILFFIPLVFFIQIYAIFVIPAALGFALGSNLLIFILIFFRRFLNKEVFLIPLFFSLFYNTILILNLSYYDVRFAKFGSMQILKELLGLPNKLLFYYGIILGISFLASILSVYIKKFISRKMALILSIIFSITSISYIFLELFNTHQVARNDTVEFLIFMVILPMAILFYFIYRQKEIGE